MLSREASNFSFDCRNSEIPVDIVVSTIYGAWTVLLAIYYPIQTVYFPFRKACSEILAFVFLVQPQNCIP